MTVLREHWPLAASLLLGLAIGWILFHPRQAAVHEKADEHLEAVKVARTDKDTERETTKDAAPTRKVVLEFDPRCPPAAPVRAGDPLPPSILRQTIFEAGPVQTITRAATETHAVVQEQASEDRHLDLTVTPPAQPGWAVQVGIEGLEARNLRLAARRRLFGPFRVELSAVPIARSVGVAAAVEW